MNTDRSNTLFTRALELFPGGVNSPVRAFRAVGGKPHFIERGEGAYLFDVDGNRFIDYVLSWGPLILGHAHPVVVAALEKSIRGGGQFWSAQPPGSRISRAYPTSYAEHGNDALCQFGNGSHHERAAPGACLHWAKQGYQV